MREYPILESAITGRINMADASQSDNISGRPSSLLDEANMDVKDLNRLRNAMLEREGLIPAIFELLRNVPRYAATVAMFPYQQAASHDPQIIGSAEVRQISPGVR